MYGSMGLAVEQPRFVAVFSSVEEGEPRVSGMPEDIAEIVRDTSRRLGVAVSAEATSYLPRHVGLGATTQTTLATGAAACLIHGLHLSPDEIARACGRGQISSVGVEVFKYGGFVVDAARRNQGHPRRGAVVSLPFPDKWVVVVAVPRGVFGLNEEEELAAFRLLPKPPRSTPERISRLILVKLLPALLDEEMQEFGEALTLIQGLEGEVFSPVQGGAVRATESLRALQAFKEAGIVGIGQSSWGPTVYGFTESAKRAEQARRAVEDSLAGMVDVYVTRARNSPAEAKPV